MSAREGTNPAVNCLQQGARRLLLPEAAHWWLFLAFVAILPIAGPIALRNLLLAVLVIQSLAWGVATYGVAWRGVAGCNGPSAWLLLWSGYLLVFPLIAEDRALAWRELGGQWLESLLAWFVTLVMVARRSLRDQDLRSIALACAVYPFLYLVLFVWAWLGGFGTSAFIEEVSWSDFLNRLAFGVSNLSMPNLAAMPWGFRGFDPLHANLGAAAASAFAAACAWGLARWRAGLQVPWALLAVLLGWSLLSPVLAYSRASVICLAGALFFTALAAGYAAWRRGLPGTSARMARGWWRATAVACATGMIVLLAYQGYERDPRWQTLSYKAAIGFVLPGATNLVCNGIAPEVEAGIRRRLAGMPTAKADEIVRGMSGDGGRALVMRSGLELVLEHPLGVDGSRNAYKRLIREKCGKEPAINFAHPHQGWIDIALALGWGGALIYLGLFLYLLRFVYLDLSRPQWTGWGVGLSLICGFWLLRGFFDSMYREHYLQMQATMIGLFWMGLRQATVAEKAAIDAGRKSD